MPPRPGAIAGPNWSILHKGVVFTVVSIRNPSLFEVEFEAATELSVINPWEVWALEWDDPSTVEGYIERARKELGGVE